MKASLSFNQPQLSRHSNFLLLRVRSEDLVCSKILASGRSMVLSHEQEGSEPLRKVRRVRFADSSVCQSIVKSCPVVTGNESKQLHDERKLCHAKDVCTYVFEQGKTLCRSHQEECVGYLDSSENLRHRLLTASDRESMTIQASNCDIKNLASIIDPSKEGSITVYGQLRLALQLARSVLEYHSTPWWRRH